MILKHDGHIFLEKFTRCAKVCGLFSLDCASWMLIGWANKLQSWRLLDEMHAACETLRLCLTGAYEITCLVDNYYNLYIA